MSTRTSVGVGLACAAALALGGCAAVPVWMSGLTTFVSAGDWVDRQAGARAKALGSASAPGSAPTSAQAEAAYRDGVRSVVERLQRDGGLPVVAMPDPARVYWVGPVMDQVWMPGQLVNGLFIPSHVEWVIVRPGFWQVADPAQAQVAPGTPQPAGARRPVVQPLEPAASGPAKPKEKPKL